jgi:hypothetical protein
VRAEVHIQDSLSFNGFFFGWTDMDRKFFFVFLSFCAAPLKIKFVKPIYFFVEHFRAIFRPEDGCVSIQRRIPGLFNGDFTNLNPNMDTTKVVGLKKMEMRLVFGQNLIQYSILDLDTRAVLTRATVQLTGFDASLANLDVGLYVS